MPVPDHVHISYSADETARLAYTRQAAEDWHEFVAYRGRELAPGGRLLYATCSLFKTEGQEQIDAFLQRHGAEHATLAPASPGHLLPLPDNAEHTTHGHPRAVHDGFFYALIHQP